MAQKWRNDKGSGRFFGTFTRPDALAARKSNRRNPDVFPLPDTECGKRSPDKVVVWKVRVELSKVVFHVSPSLRVIACEPSECVQCVSLIPLLRISLERLSPGVQGLAPLGSYCPLPYNRFFVFVCHQIRHASFLATVAFGAIYGLFLLVGHNFSFMRKNS